MVQALQKPLGSFLDVKHLCDSAFLLGIHQRESKACVHIKNVHNSLICHTQVPINRQISEQRGGAAIQWNTTLYMQNHG